MTATSKLPPDHPIWGSTPLPEWCWDRPEQWEHQVELALHIRRLFDDDNQMVLLQGPTGTGKSLVAELVRRLFLGKDSNGGTKARLGTAAYVCTTKTLQDQLAASFEGAAVLKGRGNYLTERGVLNEWGNPAPYNKYSAITCADCTGSVNEECKWCSHPSYCPYQVAKGRAVASDFAILNTSYLLADLNMGRGNFGDRGLIILDECDLLEDELLNTVEVSISNRRMERIGLDYPARKTVEEAWVKWVDYAVPRIRDYYLSLPPLSAEDITVFERREKKGIADLLEKMKRLQRELPVGGWVYTGYSEGKVEFKPVEVSGYGEEYLWRIAAKNGSSFLLMSATVISAEEMVSNLGFSGSWELVDVPMTFPHANRPVNVLSMADMRNGAEDKERQWQNCLTAVRGCVRLHPGERVIVHTVSYELSRFLYLHLQNELRDVYTYTSAGDRAYAINSYKSNPGSVLIASSLDRGIDLPGDLCRAQIIAKTPFGNLGDRRVAARLRTEGGQLWYAANAVRTIVQMTGRGIRGPDDKAVTYVVDSNFATNLYRSYRYLFPEWWQASVNMRFPVKKIEQLGSWD